MRVRAAILGVGLILLTSACAEAPRQRPSVLLITVDGLTADELSVFGGSIPTPALQKIADGGAAWADAWTASPMTRPAAATYLTGVAPDRHGVRDDLFTPLPEEFPTLAGLLAERGYHTAALPDSSYLGRSSGLLREFELADEPPMIPPTPGRWLPLGRVASQTASTTRSWISDVPAGEPYFVWVHFGEPLIGRLQEALAPPPFGLPEETESGVPSGRDAETDGSQVDGGPQTYGEAVERFDRALAEILGAVEERDELDRVLILIASTQGEVAGGEEDPFGSGFSLAERAIRVPVIASFPAGSAEPRPADRPVWAPDVPRTIAELTGTVLSDQAEGVSLLSDVADDRVMFGWSWATLDQMGWHALRAARSGGVRRSEGYAVETKRLDGDEPVAQTDEQPLARALADRDSPLPTSVPLAEIEPLLRARGLTPEPVAAAGRDAGTGPVRNNASWVLWRGRYALRTGQIERAGGMFERAQQRDPLALAPQLDLGHMMALNQRPMAVDVLERAAELYPTNPDVLHWLAHAIWPENWREAEPLLNAIRTFKQQDPDVLYDLACARSLAGDLAASEEYLRGSIDAGYRQWGLIESDPDLRNLRESGRLSEVLGEHR